MKHNSLPIILALIAIALLTYIALNAREHRTVGQKLDDAVANLDEGVDNAARELKDRTPAEKIKDAVDDVKD